MKIIQLSRKDKQQKIFREIWSWVVMLLSAIAMAILLNSTIIAQLKWMKAPWRILV